MQFHPEVVHTPVGARLIANFARHVCGLTGDWTMAEFRATKIAEIRAQVGKGRVICGLSGGVDSAVAAVRSEEHTSELQSLMRISYAVFCLKKKIDMEKQNTRQLHMNHDLIRPLATDIASVHHH